MPSNRIPAGKPDSFLIANLQADAPGNPGSHWVHRYTNEDGISAWHDPLGTHGIEQRARFEQHVNQWTDDDPEQGATTWKCFTTELYPKRLAEKVLDKHWMLNR